MRRSAVVIAAGWVLLISAIMAGSAFPSIVNSKHDLSVTGPGPIKSAPTASGGTTEICVFCHTPHSATLDAPLWNRSLPVGSYTTYTSDVLAKLDYPAVEDPLNPSAPGAKAHMKTKICMACHDGTIAMGTVVNYPANIETSMPFIGTVDNKMPQAAAGYMGTDIRDDHPVAVKHQPGSTAGQDPELKTLGATDKVRLYNAATGRASNNDGTNDGDYVECTSCHDPHVATFGKFLIDDNQNSKLCRSCHNKEGDDSTLTKESMHSNTTYATAYSPTTGGTPATLGSTVQDVKCMVCHYPHKAGLATYIDTGTAPNPGAGKYLLTYQEEKSCFNNFNRWGQNVTVCHGTTSGASTKNIASQVIKASAHKVGNYSYAAQPHNATEGSGGANWSNQAGNSWHVECVDCHNSHTAGGQLHTIGTNTITKTQPLYGAGGVEPTWSASNWTAPSWGATAYLEPTGLLRTTASSTNVTKEYQVCLRCHSTYAWNTPPGSYTDQGLEFSTGNASFHPVVTAKASTSGLIGPWTSGMTMYCSDCHGSNTPGDPGGPHGSTATPGSILISNYQNYYVAKGVFVPTTDLCFTCHSEAVYQSGATNLAGTGFMTSPTGTNLHTTHKILSNLSGISNTGYSCVNCHIRIPHGYSRKGMILVSTDSAVATYQAVGGAMITSVGAGLPASQAYGAAKGANCTTVAGCH